MNTVKNGLILSWIAINAVILLNNNAIYEETTAYVMGLVIGFIIITSVGAVLINFVGNKFIKRMREKKIKT